MEKRKQSWSLLKRLSDENPSNLSWIIGGDFNEIMYNHEKEGRAERRESVMEDFLEAIDYYKLMDLGFEGCKFTWFRGRKKDKMIKERLDRFLINFPLHLKLHMVKFKHLKVHASDHRPIVTLLSFQPLELILAKVKNYQNLRRFVQSFPPPETSLERFGKKTKGWGL